MQVAKLPKRKKFLIGNNSKSILEAFICLKRDLFHLQNLRKFGQQETRFEGACKRI